MAALEDVPEKISFPQQEEQILELWKRIDAFHTSLKLSEGRPPFTFYDGPPFATGTPHYGHILAGTIKDVVCRYAHANGFHVERRFGWDCHGLPIEFEIEKKLGIKTREEVLKMGIPAYNAECRSIVMRFAGEWEQTITRLGRWIDFKNDYKTMNLSFMETEWWVFKSLWDKGLVYRRWVFKSLWDKGLVYRGFKVMPYSTACATPLSNFEANQNYKDVSDPAVYVGFTAAATQIYTEFTYVKVEDKKSSKVLLAKQKKKTSHQQSALYKKPEEYTLIEELSGSSLVGKRYTPCLPYFNKLAEQGAFKVCGDGYVTDDAGTGVVHMAPAFGEEDYRVCLDNKIIIKGEGLLCPVDHHGRFEDGVTDFVGQYVKDADKAIIKKLKDDGRLVSSGTIVHSYPFCWRSDTPLIYKAVPSWFIRVETVREKLMANNKETYWVPDFVQEKRFHNWLRDGRDWAVSRNRFWGTPMPIWQSADGEETIVVGSVEELFELSGVRVTDLHREHVDDIVIPSKLGKGELRRVEEVFDCWFESGSMPYAQCHYPFSITEEKFHAQFPADFIAEGIDQTRGWFYTLLVLSTMLFDKPAWKNLIVNGMVLAADGKKMSKREKNYTDPNLIIDKFGSDALRLYLVNSPVVRADSLKFKDEGVEEVLKVVFLPWQNAYRFFIINARRWQLETGKKFEATGSGYCNSDNVMDRWVQAALSKLVRFVRQEMEAYRLYTVTPKLVNFIEDLTNWYVRMNRKRLKGEQSEDDTVKSLTTLFEVLLALCGLMAPFCPFLTEAMYQNLKACLPEGPQKQDSLHYVPMPHPSTEAADDVIVEKVELMQTVIELVRQARDKRKLSVKQPLAEVTVINRSTQVAAHIDSLNMYIMEEVNVRKVVTSQDDSMCSLSAVPDARTLGKRLGKDFKAVNQAVQKLTNEDCREYQAKGTIDICGQTLSGTDLKINLEFKGDKTIYEACCSAAGDLVVLLDCRMSDELKDEGTAREVVNRIQKLRKKANLSIEDKISVVYSTQDSTLGTLLVAQTANVSKAIHSNFSTEGSGDLIIEEEEQVGEAKMLIKIFRA